MQARLILIDPASERRELKLSLPTTVGRSREAKVKLVHSQVSRVHCEFFEKDGLLHVRDLGSTNGTFVGDERISESAIQPGEMVTIGAVKLQAEYEPDEGASASCRPLRGTDTIRNTGEATLQPASAQQPAQDADAPTDDSLHILPPQTEVPAEGLTEELEWRLREQPEDEPE